jgi:sulfite reductase (NADPH) flavoprotein alpha-component
MVDSANLKIFLLYASELGTGEQIAKNLFNTLRSEHVKTIPELHSLKLATCDEFHKIGLLNQDCLTIAIFIASSTGEGEPPENGTNFRGFLDKANKACFQHLSYTVLGLGDSKYINY